MWLGEISIDHKKSSSLLVFYYTIYMVIRSTFGKATELDLGERSRTRRDPWIGQRQNVQFVSFAETIPNNWKSYCIGLCWLFFFLFGQHKFTLGTKYTFYVWLIFFLNLIKPLIHIAYGPVHENLTLSISTFYSHHLRIVTAWEEKIMSGREKKELLICYCCVSNSMRPCEKSPFPSKWQSVATFFVVDSIVYHIGRRRVLYRPKIVYGNCWLDAYPNPCNLV